MECVYLFVCAREKIKVIQYLIGIIAISSFSRYIVFLYRHTVQAHIYRLLRAFLYPYPIRSDGKCAEIKRVRKEIDWFEIPGDGIKKIMRYNNQQSR